MFWHTDLDNTGMKDPMTWASDLLNAFLGKSISSRVRKNANKKPRVQCPELVFTGSKIAGAE
jgi:hypothetical protein